MKPKITIEFNKDNDFTISHDGKKATYLSYDEMLGVVSALTMPETRPCLQWLWTEQQHKEWESKYKK